MQIFAPGSGEQTAALTLAGPDWWQVLEAKREKVARRPERKRGRFPLWLGAACASGANMGCLRAKGGQKDDHEHYGQVKLTTTFIQPVPSLNDIDQDQVDQLGSIWLVFEFTSAHGFHIPATSSNRSRLFIWPGSTKTLLLASGKLVCSTRLGK